ncbi:hypothetical protein GCM10023080_020520 [Streptomyces pseudoechinosporeus]
MAVITTPDEKPAPTAERRVARRAGRPLVLNLVALAIGLTVWALASLGVENLAGPVNVAERAGA